MILHFKNHFKKLPIQNEDVHVKKNCEWIKVTHDPLAENEIKDFVSSYLFGNVYLKIVIK